jgi:hypothetical protein
LRIGLDKGYRGLVVEAEKCYEVNRVTSVRRSVGNDEDGTLCFRDVYAEELHSLS